MTKYHARPTEVDGYRFDSAAEAARYQELRLLERAGEICNLRVHPLYLLLPAFMDREGHKHQAIFYEADFEYIDLPGPPQQVTEDVKGVRTAVWRLKEKLFRHRYPGLELRVVSVNKRDRPALIRQQGEA